MSINKDKNLSNKNSVLRANDEVNIEINNVNFNVFNNNYSFSLYSGSICSNNNKVERLKNVNYSCSISKDVNENITKALNDTEKYTYIEIGMTAPCLPCLLSITKDPLKFSPQPW